ncbi:MAG: acylphosphatase [Acidiferrobacter sp.]
MHAVRFRIRGHVQGVGFRAYTCAVAQTCGVSGWVCNRDDGVVEGEAWGEGAALARFLAHLQAESAPGRVTALETETVVADPAAARGFTIRPRY